MKTNTVIKYLEDIFPNCIVWKDVKRESPHHKFHISCEKKKFNLIIERDVWNETKENEDINVLLKSVNIEEHFKKRVNRTVLQIASHGLFKIL